MPHLQMAIFQMVFTIASGLCHFIEMIIRLDLRPLKVAEMLIKKSADLNIELNAKDKYGMTAFHFACKNGHLKVRSRMVIISTWGYM